MGGGKDQSHPHFAGRRALANFVAAQSKESAQDGTLFIIDFARHSELAVAMEVDDMATLIAEIVSQLDSMARDHGKVFRVDSSLFGISWNTALNKGQCVLACTRILRELRKLPFCRHAALEIGPRIGVAQYEPHPGGARDGVNAAYLALDQTHEVYPQYAIFEPAMRDVQHRNWKLRRELTRAVERQEFELYYQPRVDLESGHCLGVEALMRWNSPRLGKVSPSEFVPVMENSGLIAEVTDWVFRRGAHELAAWLKEDKKREFAFNVSARVLMDPEFGESVKQSIGLWTMDPKQVVLEITETTIWGDRETSIPVLEELRKLGVKVAIDDFGTGYSTLEYLRDLAVDQIKIDKSFVMRMLDSKRDRFIVELVIGIAREFDLEVVAEGAENLEILRVLKQIGCSTAQGFGIAKPLPHQKLIKWSEALRKKPLEF